MRRALYWVGLVLLIGAILAYLTSGAGFDLAFTLVAGWAFYLARALPGIRLRPEGMLTPVVCLVGLVIGLHYFLGWLSEHRHGEQTQADSGLDWPPHRTLMVLSLVLLMFVAGICAVGVTHRVVWLANSPEPLLAGSLREPAQRTQCLNHLKEIGLATYNYPAVKGGSPFTAQGKR
jgi:hypothetical protein